METNSKDFGAIRNSVTGKTIREMTWNEIFGLAGKQMTQAEVMSHMKAVRAEQEQNKKKPS